MFREGVTSYNGGICNLVTHTKVYVAREEEPGFFYVVIVMVNVLSINWVILYNTCKKRFFMNPMDECK